MGEWDSMFFFCGVDFLLEGFFLTSFILYFATFHSSWEGASSEKP